MTRFPPPSPFPLPGLDSPVRVGTEGLLTALPVLLGFHPRDSLVLVATGGPGGRRVGLTLRVDLPPPEDPLLVESLCRAAADALARDAPSGAAVIVVGGAERGSAREGAAGEGGAGKGGAGKGGAGERSEDQVPPRSDVAIAAVAALQSAGVGVHTATWAAEIEAAAPWRCYPLHDCGCVGVLPDSSGTVLAATAVARGTVVRGSREELARLVEPEEPDAGMGRSARRAGGVGGAGGGGGAARGADPDGGGSARGGRVDGQRGGDGGVAGERGGAEGVAGQGAGTEGVAGERGVTVGGGGGRAGDAGGAGDPDGSSGGADGAAAGGRPDLRAPGGSRTGARARPRWPADPVHALHVAVEAAAGGRLTVDAEFVRIMSAAFRRTRFRDVALSTCTGVDAPAAEQVWAALARTCRGPAAADPAALLAVCALARGDGALANVALERAERVRPAHRLTRDLRTAMAAGWGPTEIRAWLEGAL